MCKRQRAGEIVISCVSKTFLPNSLAQRKKAHPPPPQRARAAKRRLSGSQKLKCAQINWSESALFFLSLSLSLSGGQLLSRALPDLSFPDTHRGVRARAHYTCDHRFIIVGGTCTIIAAITLLDGCANNARPELWSGKKWRLLRCWALFLELWPPWNYTTLYLRRSSAGSRNLVDPLILSL